MTNTTKWLIALPFVVLLGLVVPWLISGRLLWFAGNWADTAYVISTVGMWLAATAFVDVGSMRRGKDRTRRLLSLALILAVPVAVADRTYGPALHLDEGWSLAGIVLSLLAIGLGVAAKGSLGRYYAPHAAPKRHHQLVRRGPYRWIRHPMYTAASMWGIGWPLMVRSILGAAWMMGFLLPFLILRIREEELALLEVFGEDYVHYRARTWRLIPFVY
ncbi:MAG: isoprenylcysteine carboxylmethyltransferase family protein [Anaerolineales bacterium]|jgi:protein-S-isoprenylcysteine O-methyltransferase